MEQWTKSKASAAPVTLPDALADILRDYRSIWTDNPEGWLFATRNNRPPSSNNVVEYRLWHILDALAFGAIREFLCGSNVPF